MQTEIVAESRAILGTELDFCDIIALRSLIDNKLVAVGYIVAVHRIALDKEKVCCGEP